MLTVPLMGTSAKQQVLTLFFCLCFSINHFFSPSVSTETGEDKGELRRGERVRTAYLSESASGQEK